MTFEATGAAVAFVASLMLAPGCRWLARREKILDRPGGRKHHAAPTPLLGGLAVAGGVVLALVLVGPETTPLLRLLPALALALILGVTDDIREMTAHGKAAGQAVASALAVAALPELLAPHITGLRAADFLLAAAFLVGMMNAVNFADTFDGLCALTSAAILGVSGTLATSPDVRLVAFAGAAACIGFLPWNLSARRKLFLGDTGSLFLGLLIGAVALIVAGDYESVARPEMIPLFLCGVPIVDATTVALHRVLARRPIVVGGRDHLSHRLVLAGLTPKVAVLALAACSGATAALTHAYVSLQGPARTTLVAASWIAASAVIAVSLRSRVYAQRD